MGLLGDWLGSKRMDDPVRGTAQVVGLSHPPDSATSANLAMTVVVAADGVPPTPIKHSCICRVDRWPSHGGQLPVTVDRANPERLKVHWDEVTTGAEDSWARAQQVAAIMGGQPQAMPGAAGMGGGAMGGNVTIDLSQGSIDDGTRAQLAALGLDADALIAQADAMRAQMAPQPPAAAGGTDDMIEQLQQLGDLRDKGVLSEEEFAAAKQRLLGT